MSALLVAVPSVPLLASLSFLLGRRLGPSLRWIVPAAPALSFLILLGLGPDRRALSLTWLVVGGRELTLGLQLDGLGWTAALVVTAISAFVNLYSVAHMAEDPRWRRFFGWLLFFAGSMLALVLARSLLLLFVAWEMVGVASFALIIHHREEAESRRAALTALLLTRSMDLGFLAAWLILFLSLGTVQIPAVLSAVESGTSSGALLTATALLLILAVLGKSAQLPLSAWLSRAMVAPAPVSALLHSATMVAAGAYLILRLFPIFEQDSTAGALLLWFGAATALAGALAATAAFDLKQILAWSTVAHLGLMLLAAGAGAPAASLLLLVTHAVYKSGLFLVAGGIEHAVGTRDVRELGGLGRAMKPTAFAMVVLALALSGLPPFSGYGSGRAILDAAVSSSPAAGALVVAVVLLAALYISRATAGAVLRRPGGPKPAAHSLTAPEVTPMLALATTAVFLGSWSIAAADLPTAPAAPGGWHAAAVVATVIGLATGIWRVLERGPVPALGAWPSSIPRALDRATDAPARLALSVSALLHTVEGVTDRASEAPVRGARAAAFKLTGVERALDAAGDSTARLFRSAAPGILSSEKALDAVGDAAVRATLASAQASETAEARGVASGFDHMAAAIGRAGGALRAVQSGKLYAYLIAVFVWVLAACLVALVAAL